MLKALRVTNHTKAKIAMLSETPIADIQAEMEHYTVGIKRPYVVFDDSLDGDQYLIYSDEQFFRHYAFLDDEDPNMLTQVISRFETGL